MEAMEHALGRFADPAADPAEPFIHLTDTLRPSDPKDFDTARRNIHALCFILSRQPEARTHVRDTLLRLLATYRHTELYTLTGILPNTGFFSELFRRIGHKLLPEVAEPGQLRTFLRQVFHRPGDRHWVLGVGEEAWLQLVHSLRFDDARPDVPDPALPRPIAEILRSLSFISHWIAAIGMEPELLRLEPALETFGSPFVTQNSELTEYIESYQSHWRQTAPNSAEDTGNRGAIDDKHLRVLYGQCRQVIERIRKRAGREGTSIRLTYHLQRLQQLLRRSERLLDIAEALRLDPDGETPYPAIVTLFSRLVQDECLHNNLRKHWRQNMELIALRVTDNTRAHGEHYITESQGEYRAMARSAMIGGCIIAFMACLKLWLTKADLPPLTGALLFCLNYGLGFCLIHILHGTVATKQPAMTASAIAACIGETGGKLRNIDNLTWLIARTVRSQLIAILGNVGIAVPLAGLIAYAVFTLTGEPFVSPEKANHLFEEQSLVHSGTVFYAAIAGICLFLSGLISGYFDNFAAYNRIPTRIIQLAWPRRLLGEARMRRIATYIGDNLGALSGNFIFGFLLGGTTIFGILFGLPVDIRHVAFSSAFVGIAHVGLNFVPEFWTLLWAVLGVTAIGCINLAVSFALALNVALRARQITETPWRAIGMAVLRHLIHQPRDFFLPPKGETP
ncbi:site-specific recombinase [Propionivibrio limicola]|uniref:site-specific recombinase n=1 Tax=Propionivibrio limicola TaxID=167645 RepID=UPI001B874886|nr:site-specific recombinase [Propionivibrio limicola]